MITEAKFKLVLKDMMKSRPLEEINVTALCKKCGVHRQTFYYHYTDIYDLIAAIFLNEDLSEADKQKTTEGVLGVFVNYVKDNFSFLRSTYNSAARDLTDDFLFAKMNTTLFALWSNDKKMGLKKTQARSLARRFSHLIADEFGYCFKNLKLTPGGFVKEIGAFIGASVEMVLPAMIELSKKEGERA